MRTCSSPTSTRRSRSGKVRSAAEDRLLPLFRQTGIIEYQHAACGAHRSELGNALAVEGPGIPAGIGEQVPQALRGGAGDSGGDGVAILARQNRIHCACIP